MKSKTTGPGRRRQRGTSYVETLIAIVILSTALLGHAGSAFVEHRLARDSQARALAFQATRQFVERLRADEDFAGLLVRLRNRQLATGLTGAVALDDGTLAYPPREYYADFLLPSEIEDLVVRVEVPLDSATLALREDADRPAFGLPADLDGDGAIDDEAHDDDYRALPVRLTFRYAAPGEPSAQLRLATWLWGQR